MATPDRPPDAGAAIPLSIVITCFNYGRYLRGAVESCLDQRPRPLEVIVVDDGSTDDTREVAASFGDRIRYLRRENGGVAASRNTGFSASSGEFVLFLDADDLLLPGAAATLHALFVRFPGIDVAFGLSHPFDDATGAHLPHPASRLATIEAIPHEKAGEGVYRFTGSLFSALLRGTFIPMGGSMFRRAILLERGAFDPALRTAEDQDLLLRIAETGRFAYHHREVMRRRMHVQQLSGPRHALSRTEAAVAVHARVLEGRAAALGPGDREFCLAQLTTSAKELARHHLGAGNPARAREYIRIHRRWSGRAAPTLVLAALSRLPGPLLRLLNRARGARA